MAHPHLASSILVWSYHIYFLEHLGIDVEILFSGMTDSEAVTLRGKGGSRWKRPKSHLYEYNYDYGSNYYRSMINYLDARNGGERGLERPGPETWGERALKSYLERAYRKDHMREPGPDEQLLYHIRRSCSSYIHHAKSYSRRLTTQVNFDAILM